MELQPPTTPLVRLPAHFMHKNRLQEYTQKSAIPLPRYHTVNEGSQHAPKFRSTVLVDGGAYTSSETFVHRKEAEQDVARVAFEGILKKIKDEGCPVIYEDTTFCKAILNEFAVKMNLGMPTYTTTQPEGLLPVFVSTLFFHGKTYTGGIAKSKKEAEQLAARTVIQTVLGTESGQLLSEIIKSKGKLYSAMHKGKDNYSLPIIPCSENSGQVRKVTETHQGVQPLKKQKLEPSCGTSTGSTGNVTPVVDQAPCADQSGLTGVQCITASDIGKKRPRKKNKKKGQREILIDGRSQPGAYPTIQASCSVAQ